MQQGLGFWQPNTATSIKYTDGQVVKKSELTGAKKEAGERPLRSDTIKLCRQVLPWRRGLERFLVEKKGVRASSHASSPTAAAAAAAVATSEGKEIEVLMNHKISGETVFKWVDHDAVGGSIIPKIEVDLSSSDDEADDATHKNVWVSRADLSEEDRDLYERLMKMWKAKSNSKSAAGAQHRRAIGESSNLGKRVRGAEPTTFAQEGEEHTGGGGEEKVRSADLEYLDEIDQLLAGM